MFLLKKNHAQPKKKAANTPGLQFKEKEGEKKKWRQQPNREMKGS